MGAILTYSKSDTFSFHLISRCIFIPDNGAFFVNYVITSALTGTAIELMRIPELLVYGLKLAYARSAAEKSSVSKVGPWMHFSGLLSLVSTVDKTAIHSYN